MHSGNYFKRFLFIRYFLAVSLVAFNFNVIADWWFLCNYQPPEEVTQLVDKAFLNNNGRRIFYLGNPQISDKQEFNQYCPITERSLVLGCYSAGDIYVLKVKRPELDGVMQVTAAHEMLHAAYDRLSKKEKESINNELEEFYKTVTTPKLRQLISDYTQTDPTVRLNELHSILPTQVKTLSPALETYYQRYFTNRGGVVTAYRHYEEVFTALTQQIDSLQREISTIRSGLSSIEADLVRQKTQIETTNRELEAYRRSGDIEAYNNLVPIQNQLVVTYNETVERYVSLVEQHNQKVALVNRVALEQNELADSLDSKKFEKL